MADLLIATHFMYEAVTKPDDFAELNVNQLYYLLLPALPGGESFCEEGKRTLWNPIFNWADKH